MTQEHKQLLLKDLCIRLPYGVIVDIKYNKEHGSSDRLRICSEGSLILNTDLIGLCIEEEIHLKPYLRPMSSMTDEERLNMTKEIKGLKIQYFASSPWEWSVCGLVTPNTLIQVVDWLNKYMFDSHGLIPKGLAIELTEEIILTR